MLVNGDNQSCGVGVFSFAPHLQKPRVGFTQNILHPVAARIKHGAKSFGGFRA